MDVAVTTAANGSSGDSNDTDNGSENGDVVEQLTLRFSNGVVLTLSDFKTPYLTCSRCNSVTFINVQRVRPKDAAKSPRTLELYEQLPHCSGCGSTKYMRAGVVSFQEKIAEEQQAVKEFERRRLPAVALIQRIARGYLGRRHFRRVKLDYEHHVLMLNQSAQLIQTHVRGMQARRRIIIERCLNIIKRMHPSILRHARTIWPNRPPVFWYDNPAELKIFYWNYREFVRRAGGRPTLIKVESNVMEITRRMLLREHALVSRIQARWRGITTRMVFHEYKRQCAWWRGLRQSPAIRIQRAFKGHRSKKRCQALRIKAQYPGLKEKYKHERLVVAQRQQAVALRAKLLTKYRHEYQVDKTTRMLALPANKYAVAAPAGAAAKVLDGDNNDSAESTVAVDTTHSLRRSTPDDAAVGSPVRVVRQTRFAQLRTKLDARKRRPSRGPRLHILQSQAVDVDHDNDHDDDDAHDGDGDVEAVGVDVPILWNVNSER